MMENHHVLSTSATGVAPFSISHHKSRRRSGYVCTEAIREWFTPHRSISWSGLFEIKLRHLPTIGILGGDVPGVELLKFLEMTLESLGACFINAPHVCRTDASDSSFAEHIIQGATASLSSCARLVRPLLRFGGEDGRSLVIDHPCALFHFLAAENLPEDM